MFDVAIFTALGWERRAVTEALRAVEPAGPPRAWRGRLADGASCLLVQTGIGPARASAAAAAAPPAGAFLACGCAGGLVDWLAAGDLVTAESVIALEGAGQPAERLPAAGAGLAVWAAGRALGTIALRPRLWPAAARLARRQRLAARRLGAIMAALEVEALAAPPEAAIAAGG